jgi:hypothetical protein
MSAVLDAALRADRDHTPAELAQLDVHDVCRIRQALPPVVLTLAQLAAVDDMAGIEQAHEDFRSLGWGNTAAGELAEISRRTPTGAGMSNQIEDGGPAFPEVVTEYDPDIGRREVTSVGGMTLRDYFAAKAMPAVIGSLHGPVVCEECAGDFLRYAMAAYQMADAMLRAREGQ